jgi:hypothetical protein
MASFVHATNICTPCGDTVTVTHLASGGTAPVDKTVVYGTANNIAGEPAKCWITKNLGATRQADSVSDAADAAAGWYFQFNSKEGYEYNGTRIPASPWTNNISETSDWLTSNDPCSIELGNSWRLPSYTEFYNIMTAGNWYGDWNLPYLSALKLHAAGSLDKNSGLLHLRGVGGVYWSSNENDNSMAWTMGFFNMGSGMSTGYKAEASSVRCIRDF